MKKINLKGISEILSEKELKNVMGGCKSCQNANPCNGAVGCMKTSGGYGWCKRSFLSCSCQ